MKNNRSRAAMVLAASMVTAASSLVMPTHPAGARSADTPEPDPGAGTSDNLTIDPAVQAQTSADSDPAAGVTGQRDLTTRPSQQAMFDGLPTSEDPIPSGGPDLLHGTVTGHGTGGGQIRLYLADGSSDTEGTVQPMAPIAVATLASTGTFAFTPQITSRLTDAMVTNGEVNLLVTGTFQGASFATPVTRLYHLDTNTWTASDSATNPALALDAADPVTTSPSTQTLRGIGYGCTSSTESSFLVSSVVGEVHDSSLFTGSFTYSDQADSDLGVLFKEGGGPWKADGTVGVSKSTSASMTVPLNANEHLYMIGSFRYHRVLTQCSDGMSYSSFERVQPVNWAGGLKRSYSIGTKYCGGNDWNYRQAIEAGATFTRNRNHAVTWSGALTIYGVGLSARSGFSTRVSQSWKSAKVASWICGSGADPTVAGRVFSSNTQR